MINLDKIVNNNNEKHNENWPDIPDIIKILHNFNNWWFWIRKN